MPDNFKQLAFFDGDMPVSHIAEVLAVSYQTSKMRVKIISSKPNFEVIGDCYWRPAVPETDKKVNCQIISARLYMAGEKVFVVSIGKEYRILGPLTEKEYSTSSFRTGSDIDQADWADRLEASSVAEDGMVLTESGTAEILWPVKSDGTPFPLDNIDKRRPNWLENTGYHDNTLYVYQAERYPVEVFIPQSSGVCFNWKHINNVPVGAGSFSASSRANIQSALMPFSAPSIRIDATETSGSFNDIDYTDENRLPDISFFASYADRKHLSNAIDFSNLANHYKELFVIQRPWGAVSPPPSVDWRTCNWVPNILFCKEQVGDGSASSSLHFGFIDYRKEEYNDSKERDEVGNDAVLVTGRIDATLGQPKELPSVDDFIFTFNHSIENLTSDYSLRVEHSAAPEGPPQVPGTQTLITTATMNYGIDDKLQIFKCFSDGKNSFYKKPILYYETKSIVERNSSGVIISSYSREYISLEIDHYINSEFIFKSYYRYSTDSADELANQKIPYFRCIDLENKQFIIDFYEQDFYLETQSVTRSLFSDGSEYKFWSYSPFDRELFPTIYNGRPWRNDNKGIIILKNSNSTETYTGNIWVLPFFLIAFPPSRTSECEFNTFPPYQVGVYYPHSPSDEDIRTIILIKYVWFANLSGIPGQGRLQSLRNFSWIKNDTSGWLAFGRMCFNADDGEVEYHYGEYIKKRNGTVSGAPELFEAPDEIWKTHF